MRGIFPPSMVVVQHVAVDVLVQEVFVLRHGALGRNDGLLGHVRVGLRLCLLAGGVKDGDAAAVVDHWPCGGGVGGAFVLLLLLVVGQRRMTARDHGVLLANSVGKQVLLGDGGLEVLLGHEWVRIHLHGTYFEVV